MSEKEYNEQMNIDEKRAQSELDKVLPKEGDCGCREKKNDEH